MMHEKDYFYPLDPDLLTCYANHNEKSTFEESHDIWALGISTLCYIFNEDFNSFYDWNKKIIRRDKIDNYIGMLYNSNYDPKVLRILSEMLDQNAFTRVSIDRLYAILYQKGY